MEYALTLKDFGQGKSPIALPVSRCTPQNMTVPRCLSGHYSDPAQHGVVKQHSIAQQHNVVNLNSMTADPHPYAVIDGQHRMVALRRLGFKFARCNVVHGLSVQDEAYNFAHQRDNTKNLTARDRFKSSVIAGEEVSTKINYILTKNGYSTEAGGQGARIEAVAALAKVSQFYSYEVLDQVLSFTNATWPGDRKAVQREILVALAEFISRFHLSNTEMQARLGEQSPDSLIRQIRQAINSATGASGKSIYGKQERFTACGVLVNSYNKGFGTKSKKRLHLVWDESMIE